MRRQAVPARSADRPSLLVITPCSASKRPQTEEGASSTELETRDGRRDALCRLAKWRCLARDLYRGRHHLSVVEDIRRLREAIPEGTFRLSIVSAGYGLLDEFDWVVPYDVTFSSMRRSGARARAERLGIRVALAERAAQHDVALFLLSREYLDAIDAPLGAAASEVYFAPPEPHLSGRGVVHVCAGRDEAIRLRSNTRMVKAALFRRFVDRVVEEDWDRAVAALLVGEPFGRAEVATSLARRDCAVAALE
jgi:hypothetical protein